jgi:hypothetical protein
MWSDVPGFIALTLVEIKVAMRLCMFFYEAILYISVPIHKIWRRDLQWSNVRHKMTNFMMGREHQTARACILSHTHSYHKKRPCHNVMLTLTMLNVILLYIQLSEQ